MAGRGVFSIPWVRSAGRSVELCRWVAFRVRYLKYRWDEDRGDEYADWGASWWLTEFGPDGYRTRQIELYDSGPRLRYSQAHLEDEFGGLGLVNLGEIDLAEQEEIDAQEFEAVWRSGPWYNAGG